jgi:hypothetical protein
MLILVNGHDRIGGTSQLWGNPDKTLLAYSNAAYQHIHAPAKVYPTLLNGVTINGGAGAWELGINTEIIPANAITMAFDIHFINVEAASANDTYELVFYAGAGDGTEIGRVRTVKQSTPAGANNVPIQIPAQPANTRISAKLASATGGDNITISVFYHGYE